jgi:hypothetical protein
VLLHAAECGGRAAWSGFEGDDVAEVIDAADGASPADDAHRFTDTRLNASTVYESSVAALKLRVRMSSWARPSRVAKSAPIGARSGEVADRASSISAR